MKAVLQFPKPKAYTSAEAVIERLRTEIMSSGRTYAQIAEVAGCAHSTVANLANGKTRWPRHTTLFPILRALGLRLEVHK